LSFICRLEIWTKVIICVFFMLNWILISADLLLISMTPFDIFFVLWHSDFKFGPGVQFLIPNWIFLSTCLLLIFLYSLTYFLDFLMNLLEIWTRGVLVMLNWILISASLLLIFLHFLTYCLFEVHLSYHIKCIKYSLSQTVNFKYLHISYFACDILCIHSQKL
jgi:hypothetical protein